MAKKLYIDAQNLLEDSYRLGAKILESKFVPTYMIAIWRGGVPIGIALQEYLAVHGIETDNIAIRCTSYQADIDKRRRKVRVDGLNYLIKNLTDEDRLLIVDDVFDSGRSIAAVIEKLELATRRNMPQEVRIAVPYFKPERNQTSLTPDFYLHETDAWLKFPHSLEGLTKEELAKERPELFVIIESIQDES